MSTCSKCDYSFETCQCRPMMPKDICSRIWDEWNNGNREHAIKELCSFAYQVRAEALEEAWKEVSDLYERGQFTTDVLAKKLRQLKESK